jgi:hypothetical protein
MFSFPFVSVSSVAHGLTLEFTNNWETAFDVTDTTFDCNVNRTNGDNTTQLYLINHFLDKIVLNQFTPDVEDAATTNAVSGTGSLGLQVQTCAAQWGRNPNFMLVDVCTYCHDSGHGNSSLTVCSSTSLAVVAFSKLRPLPMVSLTAHQLRYLAHFLRALRRPRLLRLRRQMAQFYVSSSET